MVTKPQFDRPELYGFAPFKVRHFRLQTSDNATLGVYHVLPHSVYSAYVEEHGLTNPIPEHVYHDALIDPNKLTMVHLHGNAGHRLNPKRVQLAQAMSTYLDYNFVIFDYRMFGDSVPSPSPSEEGLVIDARRVWDWLTLEKGVPPSRIGINGQSLGTGVSVKLVDNLGAEEIYPRAMMLIAPYTSVVDLLHTFKIFRIFPVLGPLRNLNSIINLQELVDSVLQTKYPTKNIIQNVKCPILLVHAEDDDVIPYIHSGHLFDGLLKHTSSLVSPTEQSEQSEKYTPLQINQHTISSPFGTIRSFSRDIPMRDTYTDEKDTNNHSLVKTDDVYYLHLSHGSHSSIQFSETVIYAIKLVMDLNRKL